MERHCHRKPVGPASDVLNALGGGRPVQVVLRWRGNLRCPALEEIGDLFQNLRCLPNRERRFQV